MPPHRSRRTLSLAALVLACALGAAGCGPEPGVDEPAREGLAIDVEGIDYNVFITRELNLEIPPDSAYYPGPPATPGRALFGIFLEACNVSDEPRQTTEEFVVEDNQGAELEPLELDEDNAFAYKATELAVDACQPEPGSVAQQGPSAGSMLLFDFSLQNLENRPLELVIGSGEHAKHVELDL